MLRVHGPMSNGRFQSFSSCGEAGLLLVSVTTGAVDKQGAWGNCHSFVDISQGAQLLAIARQLSGRCHLLDFSCVFLDGFEHAEVLPLCQWPASKDEQLPKGWT